MRPRSSTLTDQELEIMKIVWQLEKATVRDVYEALLERRKVAYTTVMTMMKILEQKQYLKKNQSDRAYVYRPAQPKRQVIGAMVKDFVNLVAYSMQIGLLVGLAAFVPALLRLRLRGAKLFYWHILLRACMLRREVR